MVQTIRSGINKSDPYLLTLFVDKVGHALAPYKVVDISTSESNIYVYDSETPGQEQIIMFKDLGSGWRWEYTFRGSLAYLGTKNGGCAETYPFRLATGLEQGIPPINFCQTSSSNFQDNSIGQTGMMWIDLPADGNNYVKNKYGERLGWINDQFVNEILGGKWVPKAFGDFDVTHDNFYLPANDYNLMLSQTISPTVSSMIYGDGRVIEISGELRQPGAGLGLQINSALDSVVISGTINLSSSLIDITHEFNDFSRTATLTLNLTSGIKPINTQFDGNSIKLSGADNKFQYMIEIEQSGDEPQHFQSTFISFEPNDTQILTPVNWPDLNNSVVILQIDKNSNGTVDETITLANINKIYLPVIIKK